MHLTANPGPIAAALITLTLMACAPRPPLYAEAPPPPVDQVEVVNADALVVNGQHVRLSDAAAPQPVPEARCWAEALAARQARRATQQLTATARHVSVTVTGGRDQYDRVLGRVAVDGVDLAQTLIAQGMAMPSQPSFDWCGSVSASLSQGARLATLATPDP
ncbi:nuclease [Phenylobacterium hankyongense]|uniref:Nuclease n=1 Tax=Phenylobacterium hankyongense TaxID=1813876 RepID=A0A328AX92_9CAUL|nr:thermonuclease family protein [Phenylobacterium hankyongense]RAK59593.1 nuclease [Phenylobacterium hankyongense]